MKTKVGLTVGGSGSESLGQGFASALEWIKNNAKGAHELKWGISVQLLEPEPAQARRDPATPDMFDKETTAKPADREIVGRPALEDTRYEITCPECSGDGDTTGDDGIKQTCLTCQGEGKVKASIIGDVKPESEPAPEQEAEKAAGDGDEAAGDGAQE